jgi:uncharacterized damage-inducible protein DinB
MDEVRFFLVRKFEEIERRILLVIGQLDDDQVNWRPNESSNSIANLVVHIHGNINERIINGIRKEEACRNRDEEFEELHKSKAELVDMTQISFHILLETLNHLTDEALLETQVVRNQERSHADVLLQCAAHFSEHMGQIHYIGKMIKDTHYETTSIPKKNRNVE